MTCENPPLADMLVPYVEGALAEPDRSQVTDHLRHCPACREEIRMLRAGITDLRSLFSAGYRPEVAGHPDPADLSAAALEPDTLAPERLRVLDLHLLECRECSEEVDLLREMAQDLEGRVAPAGAPGMMPRALREEIERAWPQQAPRPEGAEALPWTERLAFLLSRFNWRPVLATGFAAVALTMGLLFAFSGRPSEMASEPPAATAPVALNEGTAASPAGPAPAATAAATTVPLAIEPGGQERAAAALGKAGVAYEKKGGDLFVKPGDLARAREAMDPPAEVAMADQVAGSKPASAEQEADRLSEAQKLETGGQDRERLQEQLDEDKAVAPPPPAPRDEAPARQDATGRVGASADDQKAKDRRETAAEKPAAKPAQPASKPTPAARATPAPARPTPATLAATQTAPMATAPASSGADGATAGGRSDPQPTPESTRVLAATNMGTPAAGYAASGAGGEEEAPPPPQPVAMEKGTATTTESAMAPPAPAGETRAAAAGGSGAGGPGVYRSEAAPGSAAPAARRAAPPTRSATVQTRAKEVLRDASVTVSDQDDGSVKVTVRLRKALTPQELEELRGRLRRELNLRDTDTLTIRQP